MRSVSIAAILCAVLVTCASAEVQPTGGVAVRDWKTPVTTMAIPMSFDVPASALKTRFPGFGDMHVKASIYLDGPCELRTGERESFVAEGTYRPAPTSSGSAKVTVRLVPTSVVYAYQHLESFNFTRSVDVWGTSGDYEVTFHLTARGRMQSVPPNTVSEILLTAPEDGSNMKMTWKDAGNDTHVPTSFQWSVWEKHWVWSNTLIAKGESSLDAANVVSVAITPGSPTLATPGKYFQNNKQYVLKLQLKRQSADYKPTYSTSYDAEFRYRQVPGGMAEKIITPLGHLIGFGDPRDLEHVANFDAQN